MARFTYHDLLALLGIGGAHPGGLEMTKSILALENLTKDSKILDVGCGTGLTASYLAKRYKCKVTALDVHPVMIAKAKERFAKDQVNINLILGDILNLPFEDNYFDLIIAESVTVFTKIQEALAEYRRVLRHQGILLDLEMTIEKPLSRQGMKEFKDFYQIDCLLTAQEWSSYMENAGFSSVEVLKGGTVSSIFQEAISSEDTVGEFAPSASLPLEIYDIWLKHQELTERHAHTIGYRVFRAQT